MRRAIIAPHYARVAAYGTKFLYFGMPESTPIPPVFDLQI
jgi:LDH2 family malate/lactate/ureidoglycolate dehydrogenase